MSEAQARPDLDLDEDLFDFGTVVQEAGSPEPEESLEEIFASFRREVPGEELLAVPVAPSAAREARRDPPARSAPAPAAAPAPAPVLPPAPARSARLSRGLVAIALSVTLLNSALAVVMLRGRPQGHDVRAVTSSAEGEPVSTAREEPLPDPESVAEAHDHPTLETAREQISQGEYAAARQRVYGLLAIIDRMEGPRRGSLEAECQFLIAQSLHLEALERMGGPE